MDSIAVDMKFDFFANLERAVGFHPAAFAADVGDDDDRLFAIAIRHGAAQMRIHPAIAFDEARLTHRQQPILCQWLGRG